MSEFSYHLKTYLTFSKKENRDLFMTGLVMTMILFFYLWAKYPDVHITFVTGKISALTIGILFIITYAILILMVVSAKLFAIKKKYTASYSGWFNGLLIGFVITFASYGFVPVAFPGIIEITAIERLRYGKPLPYENNKHIFRTLMTGLTTVFILALVFKQLHAISGSIIFEGAKDIAALILLFGILPFPNNFGSHMFYTNRKSYFIFSFISIVFALGVLLNSSFALIIGLVGGALLWLLFSKYWGALILPEKK